MGIFDAVTSVLGAVQEALGTQSGLMNQLFRTNVERARAELRLGADVEADKLLVRTLDLLNRLGGTETDERKALIGVVNSVRAQVLERQGEPLQAADLYRTAIEELSSIPDESLSPRDRSDLGIALSFLGSDTAARQQIELARSQKGETPEAAIHLARILIDQGQYDEANQLLVEVQQILPNDAAIYLLMGRVLARQGHPAAPSLFQRAAYLLLEDERGRDARAAIESARHESGDDQLGIGLYAEALRLEGNLDRAVVEFEQALVQDPTSQWLLTRYARTLLAAGRSQDALNSAVRALEQEPSNSSTLILCAEAALDNDEPKEALRYCVDAISADPSNPRPYLVQARARLIENDPETALESLQTGRALAPQDIDLLRMHANLEAQIGHADEAMPLLAALVTLPLANKADHWVYAEMLAARGSFDRAAAVLESAINRWPDDPRLLELLGDVLRRNGEIERSTAVLRHAVALDPLSARAHVLLGLTMQGAADSDAGMLQAAQAAFQHAAALQPDWADPPWLLAVVYQQLGDQDRSELHARAALDIDPTHRGAMRLLANMLLEAGKPAEADIYVRQLMRESSSNDPTLTLLLARCLLDRRRPHKALRRLIDVPEEIRRNDQALFDWLRFRGQANAELGDTSSAFNDFSQALQIDSTNADVWYRRATVALERGDGKQALEDCEQSLRLRPDHVQTLGVRGAALMKLGLIPEAQATLSHALEMDGEYVFAMQLLAQASARSQPEAAQEFLDRAMALDPENVELKLEVGWVHLGAGDYERAFETFKGLTDSTDQAEAYSGLSESLRLLGRPNEAALAAEEALERRPDDPQALNSLGFSLMASGLNREGLEVFKRAYEGYPDDVHAKVNYARACAQSDIDDLDKAIMLLDEACLQLPTDPWPLATLGWVALTIGANEEAVALYRRALAVDVDNPSYWYGLGWAALRQEQPLTEVAEQSFLRAQALDGEDMWIRSSVAEVLHIRGDPVAAEQFESILDHAQSLRNERPDLLEIVGWAGFRLGGYTMAARALLEVLSTEQTVSLTDFDFALVMFVDPETAHGREAYETALAQLEDRHSYARRGILKAALADFQRCLLEYPYLSGIESAGIIEQQLKESLAETLVPPVLQSVASVQ